jgi:serine/threonine protein phosphatase PrpC
MIPDQELNKDKPARKTASFDTAGVPAALTDTGCERPKNEDRFLVLKSALGMGYFVFDGMGGEPGGEAAAQLSVDSVRSYFEKASGSDLAEVLRESLQGAHEVIASRRQNPKFASMGTTVVAALCGSNQVVIASVGDSRAYYVAGGTARQLTADHTFVQQLVDQGHVRPEDALMHPQSHILTRCLGSAVGFGIDLYKFWVTPSTEEKRQGALLLCSDGLYSLVSEPDLATIIGTYSPLEACTKLIELARERGGYDNITAIVIPLAGELRDEQAPPARAPEDAVTPSVLKPSAHRQKKRRAPLSSHLGLLGIVGVVSMALTVLGFLFFAILRD